MRCASPASVSCPNVMVPSPIAETAGPATPKVFVRMTDLLSS